MWRTKEAASVVGSVKSFSAVPVPSIGDEGTEKHA